MLLTCRNLRVMPKQPTAKFEQRTLSIIIITSNTNLLRLHSQQQNLSVTAKAFVGREIFFIESLESYPFWSRLMMPWLEPTIPSSSTSFQLSVSAFNRSQWQRLAKTRIRQSLSNWSWRSLCRLADQKIYVLWCRFHPLTSSYFHNRAPILF